MSVRRVALLTAGGFAPCLSSAVGGLIERYTEIAPEVEIIAYQQGYHGLLLGEKVVVSDEVRKHAGVLHRFGGSPIGNSRVKLTNRADAEKRGLVKPGEDPLQVAAEQLKADGVDVLHTIGGDDTNTTAADLAAYLHQNGYELTVVGLPKTIDNDVVPIRQSLGAWTAAEPKLAQAENVRATLAFVARGETPIGIVYETDAKVDLSVRIVAVFPEDSHAPIRYPVAVVKASKNADAAKFVAYLDSPAAQAIFTRYGFAVLGKS